MSGSIPKHDYENFIHLSAGVEDETAPVQQKKLDYRVVKSPETDSYSTTPTGDNNALKGKRDYVNAEAILAQAKEFSKYPTHVPGKSSRYVNAAVVAAVAAEELTGNDVASTPRRASIGKGKLQDDQSIASGTGVELYEAEFEAKLKLQDTVQYEDKELYKRECPKPPTVDDLQKAVVNPAMYDQPYEDAIRQGEGPPAPRPMQMNRALKDPTMDYDILQVPTKEDEKEVEKFKSRRTTREPDAVPPPLPIENDAVATDTGYEPTRVPWYHGNISREESQVVFKKKAIEGKIANGDFLLRKSTKDKDLFVLVLFHGGSVYQNRVEKGKDDFYLYKPALNDPVPAARAREPDELIRQLMGRVSGLRQPLLRGVPVG
eukprot:m.24346 g.24346  ORF g.24346 m.24346 type:complete len:375 (-) comp7601_c0_seq1:1319-2443(-)